MADEAGKVEGIGVGDVAGAGDVADVGESGREERRDRVSGRGDLDEESDDSKGFI